ncbi:MAG: ATP-binding cassette domain-containing protein, partial [bacterium]
MVNAENPVIDSTTAPLLTVSNLTISYTGEAGPVRAVDALSFAISTGETLGIVGESGSGKSTVARCIARLIDPTTGTIHLDADEIGRMGRAKLRRHRKRGQIVFQD